MQTLRILLLVVVASLAAFAQAPVPANGHAGISNQAQPSAPQQPLTPKAETHLQAQVEHALNMLPTYSVFDLINFQVQGTTVILGGQVRTIGLKAAAEDSVRKVEGVEKVVNNIELLPPSSSDDHLRIEIARVIFNTPALQPYALGVVPPIHILVDNGHVTLVGYVNSQADKDTAGLKTTTVPGVLSVNNDLRVEK